MKLTDLRDELSDRADSVETPDLLAGVHRRIRTTRRRRMAGSVTALAAVVALGIAVVPGLTTSAPEPAGSNPPDYVRDAVTISGMVGTDRLDKPWVGSVGETVATFSWTPTTKNIAVYAYCAAPGATRYAVQIGGRNAAEGPCNAIRNTPDAALISEDSPLWLDVPLDQVTTVNVRLTDNDGKTVESSSAQLGVGIYQAGKRDPLPGATDATPTPGPGDREEEGLRFRGKVGGDTLVAAAAAKPGVGRLSTSYTSTGRPMMIRDFCTANDTVAGFPYELRVMINGEERRSGCLALSTDLGSMPGSSSSGVGKPGERVTVTAKLTDLSGREVTVPGARIGFAVYEQGPQRVYEDAILDERTEYLGTTYQLAEAKAVDATSTPRIQLQTPADTPFLIAYGSSSLGGTGVVSGTLDGLSGHGMLSTDQSGSTRSSWGMIIDGNRAGPSKTVSLSITQGTPTKGKLILAIYTPVK